MSIDADAAGDKTDAKLWCLPDAAPSEGVHFSDWTWMASGLCCEAISAASFTKPARFGWTARHEDCERALH